MREMIYEDGSVFADLDAGLVKVKIYAPQGQPNTIEGLFWLDADLEAIQGDIQKFRESIKKAQRSMIEADQG